MSRIKHNFERMALGSLLAFVPILGFSQTIQEYSDAQKKAIAGEVQKSYPEVAKAPAPGKTTAPVFTPAVYSRKTTPSVQVIGVSHVKGRQMAEVAVDGTVHMVPQGVKVPGTNWIVKDAAISRVELVEPRDPKVKRSKDRTRVIDLPSIEVR